MFKHGLSWPEAIVAVVFMVCLTLAYLGRMGALPWQVVYDGADDEFTDDAPGEVSHDSDPRVAAGPAGRRPAA
jgi:hypothetical protein